MGSSRSVGATKLEAVNALSAALLMPPSNVTSEAEKTVASKSSKTPAAETLPSLMKANCSVEPSTLVTIPIAMGVPLPLMAMAGAEPNWSISLVAVVEEVTAPVSSVVVVVTLSARVCYVAANITCDTNACAVTTG